MKHEVLLCKIYDNFLERTQLPKMSADELWFDIVDKNNQKENANWLQRFTKLWDKCSPIY